MNLRGRGAGSGHAFHPSYDPSWGISGPRARSRVSGPPVARATRALPRASGPPANPGTHACSRVPEPPAAPAAHGAGARARGLANPFQLATGYAPALTSPGNRGLRPKNKLIKQRVTKVPRQGTALPCAPAPSVWGGTRLPRATTRRAAAAGTNPAPERPPPRKATLHAARRSFLEVSRFPWSWPPCVGFASNPSYHAYPQGCASHGV